MAKFIKLCLIQLALIPKCLQTCISFLTKVITQNSFHLRKPFFRTIKSKHL